MCTIKSIFELIYCLPKLCTNIIAFNEQLFTIGLVNRMIMQN